jgi:FixJ family two-component response regulator
LSQESIAIPIIFVTGHGDVPMSVRAMKSGAVDFLEKPFNDQALLEAIRRGIERDRTARAEAARRDDVAQRLALLTRREREVLELIVAGKPNKMVAAQLGIAEKTVKIHRGRVMRKMRAGSFAELVQLASLKT